MMNKRHPYRALLAMCIICTVLLAACAEAPAATTQPEPTKTAYMLTHVESGIISYSADDFQASGSLLLYGDGNARLDYAGQTTSLVYDQTHMWTSAEPDILHAYRISGKVLVLEYHSESLTFLEK